MYYLKTKAVKGKLKELGYQINKEALNSLDSKVDDYLNRLTKVWNGHHKRITKEVINLTTLK